VRDLGTDYAGYRGTFDLGMPVQEIEGMADAGMSPIEIIVAATRNGARACGLEGDLGTLEPGKIADIIVVSGDPLADIRALSRIAAVVREGVLLSSRGN
jgi:imidazolonepropionase-like amidohydrolase